MLLGFKVLRLVKKISLQCPHLPKMNQGDRKRNSPYTIILEIKFHSFQSQEVEALELAFLRIYALAIYIKSKDAVANSKNNNSINIKIKGQRVACTGTMKNLIVLVAQPPLFATHSSEHFILLPLPKAFPTSTTGSNVLE